MKKFTLLLILFLYTDIFAQSNYEKGKDAYLNANIDNAVFYFKGALQSSSSTSEVKFHSCIYLASCYQAQGKNNEMNNYLKSSLNHSLVLKPEEDVFNETLLNRFKEICISHIEEKIDLSLASNSYNDAEDLYRKLRENYPDKEFPRYGTFSIASSPAGAEVNIDGKVITKTPVKLHKLQVGNYSLEVAGIDGYESFTVPLEVKWNRNTFLENITLRKALGKIVINTNLNDVQLTVTGKENNIKEFSGRIKNGDSTKDIKFGEYIVSASSGKYGEILKELTINQVKNYSMEFEFKGSLKIIGSPAGADVFINGKKEGVLPLIMENLIVGTFSVEVDAAGYDKKNMNVDVSANKIESVQISINPKSKSKAMLKSIIFPGLGQKYSGRKLSSVMMFLTCTAAGAASIMFNNQYNKSEEEYNAAFEEYSNAITDFNQLKTTVDSKYKSMKDNRKITNYMLYALSGFYIYNILDAAIFMPRLKDNSSLADNINFNLGLMNFGMSVSLKYKF